MIEDLPTLLAAAAGGTVIAVLYLFALRLSIRAALASEQAALWLVAGGFVRILLVCLGLWWVAGGRGAPLVAAALGFIVARLVGLAVERRRGGERPTPPAPEEGA
jgi:F1F0 ATPase subunit 2